MVDFKLIEITSEVIMMPYGELKEVETLIASVSINNETRLLNFHQRFYSEMYINKSDEIYVQIPQYGTPRAWVMNEYNDYYNKVRKANLYVQKINDDFKLITRYLVLNSRATITGWINSINNPNRFEEAIDFQRPVPEKF